MIIKKYQAKTEKEALEAAKRELGNSVVIMNHKYVKKKGLFAFLMPQMYEITAAVEDDPDNYGKGVATAEKPKQSQSEKEVNSVSTLTEAAEAIKSIAAIQSAAGDPFEKNDSNRKEFEKPMSPMEHYKEAVKKSENSSLLYSEDEQEVKASNMESQKSVSESKILEQKLESLQNLIERQLVKTEDTREDELSEEEQQKNKEMQMFLKLLYNTMIDNEVDEKYANQILDEMDKVTKNNMPIDYVLANVYQKMILKFGRPLGITPSQNHKPKVIFFIGPTGVGKTTTIAKIASKFHVEEDKKVALLTADTYRIAAAEQLRTYADIMDVPFRVIYSKDEVESAYEDYKEYDYILVDTAGHSHHNDVQKQNMSSFIHSLDGVAEVEVFLVVSATTKYRDLISIADTYKEMTDYKIIFTKLDETTTLGNLLNLKLHTGSPLSYVTCGQNVPEDIENFNPQATVKQLLRIKKLEREKEIC